MWDSGPLMVLICPTPAQKHPLTSVLKIGMQSLSPIGFRPENRGCVIFLVILQFPIMHCEQEVIGAPDLLGQISGKTRSPGP